MAAIFMYWSMALLASELPRKSVVGESSWSTLVWKRRPGRNGVQRGGMCETGYDALAASYKYNPPSADPSSTPRCDHRAPTSAPSAGQTRSGYSVPKSRVPMSANLLHPFTQKLVPFVWQWRFGPPCPRPPKCRVAFCTCQPAAQHHGPQTA